MINDSYNRFDDDDDDDTINEYVPTIITSELGKLKTHSPIYWSRYDGDNWLNLTHTLDSIYLTSILEVQYVQISVHNDDNEIV